MKKEKVFLGIIVLALAAAVVYAFWGVPYKGSSQKNAVLFYGDGCPHCEIVDKFVEENKVREKVQFERKEVFNNRTNANEMASRAKNCGIKTSGMGVPFLWDGEKCYQGDVDVIEFFKKKINEK